VARHQEANQSPKGARAIPSGITWVRDRTTTLWNVSNKTKTYWLYIGLMWKQVCKAYNIVRQERCWKILQWAWGMSCEKQTVYMLPQDYTGWIYAPPEVQIIPCQIHGIYIFGPPSLKQPFQADGYGGSTWRGEDFLLPFMTAVALFLSGLSEPLRMSKGSKACIYLSGAHL